MLSRFSEIRRLVLVLFASSLLLLSSLHLLFICMINYIAMRNVHFIVCIDENVISSSPYHCLIDPHHQLVLSSNSPPPSCLHPDLLTMLPSSTSSQSSFHAVTHSWRHSSSAHTPPLHPFFCLSRPSRRCHAVPPLVIRSFSSDQVFMVSSCMHKRF